MDIPKEFSLKVLASSFLLIFSYIFKAAKKDVEKAIVIKLQLGKLMQKQW